MRNMPLKTKLWTLTIFLFLLILSVALNSIRSINKILFADKNYSEAVELCNFMFKKEIEHLVWINKVTNIFILESDAYDIQTNYMKCDLGKFLYGDTDKALLKKYPEIYGLLEAIRTPHKNLHESANQAIYLWQKKSFSEARRVYEKETLVYLKETQKKMDLLMERIHTLQDLAKKEMTETGAESKQNSGIIMLIAFIFGSLISLYIIYSVTKSIFSTINGLNTGTDVLVSSSEQVSSASQFLSENTYKNASAIEETSSFLEDMAFISKQNLQNAKLSDDYMKQNRQTISKANESMNELVESTEDISQAIGKTSEIIKTIDKIAFKTNLLALNAAIEAARAGEAGIGFAVVADEVRNLAAQTTESAKQTSLLIQNIVTKVNKGSGFVRITNEIFSQTGKTSEECGELVRMIAESSEKQYMAVEHISNAVTEIEQMMRQNSAGAEELTSISEELNAQAEKIKLFAVELISLIKYHKEARSRK